MATNLKSATPKTSIPGTGFVFGANAQSDSDPSIYSLSAIAKAIRGDFLYVADYCDNTGSTDVTDALTGLVSTGKPLMFGPGTYKISGTVDARGKGRWIGAGPGNYNTWPSAPTIIQCEGDNGGAPFVYPPCWMDGILFKGDSKQGIGLLCGATDRFESQQQWSNFAVQGFATGVLVRNSWMTKWSNFAIIENGLNVHFKPETFTTDGGYITTWLWENGLVSYADGYGIDFDPEAGSPIFVWTNVAVEANNVGGDATAQIRANRMNLSGRGVYGEGRADIPWLEMLGNCRLNLIDARFNGTGGVKATGAHNTLDLEHVQHVHGSDKTFDFNGNPGQRIRLRNAFSLAPADIPSGVPVVLENTAGLVYWSSEGGVQTGPQQDASQTATYYFQATLASTDIDAGETVEVIADWAQEGIFEGNTVGRASISGAAYPGLVFTVTQGSDADSFSVYATNVTGSAMTGVAGTVSVVIEKAAAARQYGPELVTNGAFDADSNWTLQAGWTISGGTLNGNVPSGNNVAYQVIGSLANNTLYKIEFEVSDLENGGIAINLAGVEDFYTYSEGSYSYLIETNGAATEDPVLYIVAYDGFKGKIDNVSLKEAL